MFEGIRVGLDLGSWIRKWLVFWFFGRFGGWWDFCVIIVLRRGKDYDRWRYRCFYG